MPPTPDHSEEPDVELSVVIPAFNAAETIEAQLHALTRQQWNRPWEVVVADNGSTDQTSELVHRISQSDHRVRLVDASDRSGAATARNRGVEGARGHLIAFCDADDVVGEGWVAAMGDALHRASFVTGPQDFEMLNPPWLHGVYGTLPARELQTFSGIFSFGPTANLGIRRALLEEIGGFDPSIFVYEDLELCLRLWLKGIELQFLPEAVVHYRYRGGLGRLWSQAVQYGAAAPDIARRLAAAGRRTPSRWRGVRNWIWLVGRLPNLRTKAGRARWVVVAGGCAGRIVGSVRSRHLML